MFSPDLLEKVLLWKIASQKKEESEGMMMIRAIAIQSLKGMAVGTFISLIILASTLKLTDTLILGPGLGLFFGFLMGIVILD